MNFASHHFSWHTWSKAHIWDLESLKNNGTAEAEDNDSRHRHYHVSDLAYTRSQNQRQIRFQSIGQSGLSALLGWTANGVPDGLCGPGTFCLTDTDGNVLQRPSQPAIPCLWHNSSSLLCSKIDFRMQRHAPPHPEPETKLLLSSYQRRQCQECTRPHLQGKPWLQHWTICFWWCQMLSDSPDSNWKTCLCG